MSKVRSKSGKSTKAGDVLGKVKSGGVMKPAQTAKAQSKKIVQNIAKDKKKAKQIIKQPTPDDSDDSNSDDSASDSESEEEVKVPAVPAKAGKTKSTLAIKDESEEDEEESEDSEDESNDETKPNGAAVKPAAPADDESDDESDESESNDEEPAMSAVTGKKLAQAPIKNGAEESDEEEDEESSEESESEVENTKPAAKMNGHKAESSEEEEDSDSSEESDSDDEAPAVPKINGAAKAKPEPADDDDEEDDEEDEDSDSDSDDSDESDEEEEEEEKPAVKTNKRKAEEEAVPTTKKAKTQEIDASATSNLFIGNLSWNVTEDWLREEFSDFGELTGVRIVTDRQTGRSKGFGYVEFVNAADAVKAHAAKKETDLDGRTLNVDFANARPTDQQRQDNRSKAYGDTPSTPSDTLFVGNLPFSVTPDMVSEAFEVHGTITGVRLPTDQESGKPRGFGYITFASIDEATTALEAMSGFYLDGRPLRLDYSPPRDQNRNNESPRGGFGGRGRGFGDRGRGGFGDRGRGGFGGRGDRGSFGGRGRGRGAPRGGRGGSTNRGGFGDFSGKKVSFD